MSKTQPIKDEETLKMFRNYYRDIEPNPRNYALIVFGLNSALRISDILGLCWKDVYSDEKHTYHEHIIVWEQNVNCHSKTSRPYSPFLAPRPVIIHGAGCCLKEFRLDNVATEIWITSTSSTP